MVLGRIAAAMTRSAWMAALAVFVALAPSGRAQEGEDPGSPRDPAGRAGPAEAPPVAPFEASDSVPPGPIDERVTALLREKGIRPAHACSDAVFVRRVFLDVTGALPSPQEAVIFLEDRDPGKRAALIDALLERDGFADYGSLKWCDLLRVKAEFPINLWPNGVQAYHRWIHDALRANQPYDRFVRELLTASGSNFRVPPVNFYRALQGKEPAAVAAAVALAFMGVRVENWPAERRSRLQAFFSRVAFKGTAEWKEVIVHPDPAPAGPLDVVFPDGSKATIPEGTDPRAAFADWLTAPGNEWFARNIVNRVWSWLMGRGIVHEPDDFRPDNPPSNPALLDYLARELVGSGYDLRRVYRLILNSRTYQRSPIPQGDHPDAAALFAFYPVRRLDAEVLADALRRVCGFKETYSSMIPEPFTFIPADRQTVTLADGSTTGPFLELFGRPPRDTGQESERNNSPSDAQRLFLLNSSAVQKGLGGSSWIRRLARDAGDDPRRVVRTLYLTVLSREPTAEERSALEGGFKARGAGVQEAAIDLAWALINTKEFQYRH
jgi:hypothetical protein